MPRWIKYDTTSGKILGRAYWTAPTSGTGEATAELTDPEWRALNRETQRYDATAEAIRPATQGELDAQDQQALLKFRQLVEQKFEDAVDDREAWAVVSQALFQEIRPRLNQVIDAVNNATGSTIDPLDKQDIIDRIMNIVGA